MCIYIYTKVSIVSIVSIVSSWLIDWLWNTVFLLKQHVFNSLKLMGYPLAHMLTLYQPIWTMFWEGLKKIANFALIKQHCVKSKWYWLFCCILNGIFRAFKILPRKIKRTNIFKFMSKMLGDIQCLLVSYFWYRGKQCVIQCKQSLFANHNVSKQY